MPTPDLTEFDVTSQLDAESIAEFAPMQKSYKWGYWRTADDLISIAPTWPTERIRLEDQGCTYLRRYGEFLVTGEKGWSPSTDPFRLILARGGAKEFALDQILEHGWHRNAPMVNGRRVKFTQLDTEEAKARIAAEQKCKYCARRFLTDASLSSHERVAHRDTSQQATLVRGLSDALGAAQQNPAALGDDLASVLTQLASTQALIVEMLKGQQAKATR